jgi:hypothetical protein
MSTVLKNNGHSYALLELGQTIGEAATEFSSNGATVAVVCHDSQYVGLLRRDVVSRTISADPGVAEKNIEHLGPLPSPFLPDNSSPLAVRRFVNEHELEVIPFMDRRGRLTKLLSPQEALNIGLYENAAVVMSAAWLPPAPDHREHPEADGPAVSGKLLDRIIDHLLDCGFYHFIAVHYLKEQVMDYLGDGLARGRAWISGEENPLAPPASAVVGCETLPILVSNGDVITNQRWRVLRFHNQHKAEITIVCKEDRSTSATAWSRRGRTARSEAEEKPRLATWSTPASTSSTPKCWR